jgi:tetratricopeptide (TPR) repeat protein
LFLYFAIAAFGKNDTWVEVRTPHFTVLCNDGEKEARRLGDQFERMRAVFRKALPNVAVDAPAPIVVIAVKDRKDFQALEPAAYLGKGQLNLAGLFLRTPDKNYVLLRLDTEGEHPYETVYHEYTHFLLSRDDEWMPLWVNEGLAEFYETTDIRDKEVELGQPSTPNLALLRQNRLLPLGTLFQVDHDSPYYREENKGSIFYAESWALTHCLMIEDRKNNTQKLRDYLELVSTHVDPLSAAIQAFGDLATVQKHLEAYVAQGSFSYFRMPADTGVDDSTFKVRPVSLIEADAVRADLLAYNRRESDARAILDHLLQQDPTNVQANETMGYLAYRSGNLDEAQKWFGEAVKYDSQSYLANYYFGAIAMRDTREVDATQIEKSLRAAIKLNPSFAPSYDALAMYYLSQHKNLSEARMLSVTAVDLDPNNVAYRLNNSNLQMELNHPKDAIAVLTAALKFADTPELQEQIKQRLASIQGFVSAMEENEKQRSPVQAEVADKVNIVEAPVEDDTKHGPKHTVRGTLREVACTYPSRMTLTVVAPKPTKPVELRSINFSKIEYSALGFTPKGDLDPCHDLSGMKAKVDYFESAESGKPGWVVAIQLTK